MFFIQMLYNRVEAKQNKTKTKTTTKKNSSKNRAPIYRDKENF